MAQPTLAKTTEQAAPTTGRRSMILLVGAAVALYWSSLYLYVPTLPVYAQEKIGDLARVGVVLSMYGLWQAVVRLPLGIAADWLGRRKPFILLGFALSALGAWVMVEAGGFEGLAAGRAITGLSAAAWVPLAVLFSSLFKPEEAVRAAALLSLINSLSRVIATSVTGSINTLSGGYEMAFLLAAGVAGLAILVTLPVREAARPPRPPSLRGTGRLITRRDVLLPALLSAVSQYLVWATTFGFIPILAKNLGASDEINSLLVSLNLGLGIAGNLVTSTLARRFGNLPLVYWSFAISVVGVLIAGFSSALWMVFAAQILIGFGQGIGYPLYMGMSIEKVAEEERATAMGLHQAVYATGMFAGPWLSGILADAFGLSPMFFFTAISTLLLAVGIARLLEKR